MPTVPKQLEHALQRARSSPLLQKGGVLGIDIGSSSIKIVQLRASLEKPILEPVTRYESEGLVKDVVFPTGALLENGQINI